MTKQLKKHLSVSEQVALMISRGLVVANPFEVENTLLNINYYRLSGYLHDFKKKDSDDYIDGLTWERLKHIYDFDRKLTRILLFALEDIEETLKTRLSYYLTGAYPADPLIYLKPPIYRDYDAYLEFLFHFFEELDKKM